METTIVLTGMYEANINGKKESLLRTWPAKYDANVPSVKQATSLFIIVRGYGFQVLYSPENAIYIRLDPYYMEMVSIGRLSFAYFTKEIII